MPVDYEITNTKLSHTADLEALCERIEEAFKWYDTPPKGEVLPEFVAPYFPIIQSSGMGKTKLLYEVSKVLNDIENTCCTLCLPGEMEAFPVVGKPTENKGNVFSTVLSLDKVADRFQRSDSAPEAAEAVMQELDKHFPQPSHPKNRFVILFDEAQVLLREQFELDAFLFQCVRLWLRQAREGCQYIAVFSGTASTLSNFYPDSSLVRLFTSRGSNRNFCQVASFCHLRFSKQPRLVVFLQSSLPSS